MVVVLALLRGQNHDIIQDTGQEGYHGFGVISEGSLQVGDTAGEGEGSGRGVGWFGGPFEIANFKLNSLELLVVKQLFPGFLGVVDAMDVFERLVHGKQHLFDATGNMDQTEQMRVVIGQVDVEVIVADEDEPQAHEGVDAVKYIDGPPEVVGIIGHVGTGVFLALYLDREGSGQIEGHREVMGRMFVAETVEFEVQQQEQMDCHQRELVDITQLGQHEKKLADFGFQLGDEVDKIGHVLGRRERIGGPAPAQAPEHPAQNWVRQPVAQDGQHHGIHKHRGGLLVPEPVPELTQVDDGEDGVELIEVELNKLLELGRFHYVHWAQEGEGMDSEQMVPGGAGPKVPLRIIIVISAGLDLIRFILVGGRVFRGLFIQHHVDIHPGLVVNGIIIHFTTHDGFRVVMEHVLEGRNGVVARYAEAEPMFEVGRGDLFHFLGLLGGLGPSSRYFWLGYGPNSRQRGVGRRQRVQLGGSGFLGDQITFPVVFTAVGAPSRLVVGGGDVTFDPFETTVVATLERSLTGLVVVVECRKDKHNERVTAVLEQW